MAGDTVKVCIICGRKFESPLSPLVTLQQHEALRAELDAATAAFDDPNRPIALCHDCAREHHAYWDERWDEYYRGIL